MASGSSEMAPGGPSPLSECRIVLLGKAGAGTNRVARGILGSTTLINESKECILYEGEHAGRRICLIDTPGWGSAQSTRQKIQNEIARSVTLCPPGPHALVLVLPVKSGEVPSPNEFESAHQHMELLSKRVWKYTLVLYLCDGNVEESTIKEYIQKAETLEKCSAGHYVMHLNKSETQFHGLLQKINNMVKENLDDFFLPPVYYEVFQSKIPQNVKELEIKYEDKVRALKQEYQRRLKEHSDQPLLRRRRGSFEHKRPSLSEDENQAVDAFTIRGNDLSQILPFVQYYFKPICMLLLVVIGALIGSVVGSDHGVMGSGLGIVIGVIVTIPLFLCLIKASHLVLPLVEERKSETIRAQHES